MKQLASSNLSILILRCYGSRGWENLANHYLLSHSGRKDIIPQLFWFRKIPNHVWFFLQPISYVFKADIGSKHILLSVVFSALLAVKLVKVCIGLVNSLLYLVVFCHPGDQMAWECSTPPPCGCFPPHWLSNWQRAGHLPPGPGYFQRYLQWNCIQCINSLKKFLRLISATPKVCQPMKDKVNSLKNNV